MHIRSIALSLALLSSTVLAIAAETHTFDLLTRGKKTATVSYTLDNAKNGAKVRSSIDYTANTAPTRVVEYKVTPEGLFNSGTITTAQTHTILFYTPNKTRDTLQMAMNVNSESKGITTVPIAKPDFLLAFPDDATVWQVLLDTHKAHPHADSIYTLLQLSNRDTSSRLQPLRLETPTPSTGTFDGKAIALQHYVVTFSSGKAHLYTTEDGKLMQADIPLFGVTHVRTSFALDK